MKQIITQHGWGLNKYFWDDYKVDFLKNNWHWQDNERGYFSTNNYQAKWIVISMIEKLIVHSKKTKDRI